MKSKYVCQGQKLRLRCNRHDVLRIYSANYGRLEPGTSICPHQNISSLSCRAPNVLSKMRVRCDNKPKCTVRADGAVFGDPCPETYKYFEVIYGCGKLRFIVFVKILLVKASAIVQSRYPLNPSFQSINSCLRRIRETKTTSCTLGTSCVERNYKSDLLQ